MSKRVLILCTGNCCRSPMAEGLWRKLAGDEWEAFSAGSNPAGYVHPLAIAALAELDVDISTATSQHVREYFGESFDLVVTVCDHAATACPTLPGATRTLHWPFDDPIEAEGTPEEQLVSFRRVRDEIRQRIESFLAEGA